MAISYDILLTDMNLNYVGDPIIDWVQLDITLRFNEPSGGFFTIPNYPWLNDQLPRPATALDPGVPGRRVVIIRDLGAEYGHQRSVLISGPIEEVLDERSDDGENAGIGMLTVHFADDLSKVAARQVYPNGSQPAGGQTADRWQFTGNAEMALRALVNENAGPAALAARRIPNLVLGDLQGVGGNVTVDAQRMQPMGELMREIADTGGKLGFRTRQVGNQILYEAYQPPDKTGSVRFGFGLGNMKYLSRQVSAPKVTAAIVGGQGEGADRNLIERTNATDEAAWGRYETLVSRPGNNAVQELNDDGDKALAEGAATVRVTSNVSDLPDQRFGVHYVLGDKVAVETRPGEQLADLVVTVHVQAWNSAGEYVSPTVGSQAATTDPVWATRLREIEERVGRVERTVKPAVLPA